MIEIIEKILVLIGVPGKIIAGALIVGLISVSSIYVYSSFESHESKLDVSYANVPASKRADSLILVNQYHLNSKLDTILVRQRNLLVLFKASTEINKTKFDAIIKDNRNLNTLFEGFDNNLRCLIQMVPLTKLDQKKNSIPFETCEL